MKRHAFGLIYAVWVVGVLLLNRHNDLFSTQKPLVVGKFVVWLTFIGFSAYTIYCSMTEHFFKSLRKILAFSWGKQIGSDLTLGLLIFIFIVYLHSGSALTALLWLIPCICFGNLAALLYLAVYFDAIVGIFLK
jgi:hypothetical protein